jgi:hypothetical protein
VPIAQEAVAQVRAEETRRPGDEDTHQQPRPIES